jgi:hypothetical protein
VLAVRTLYGCVGSVGAVLIAIAANAPFSGVLGATFLGTIFGNLVGAIVVRSYV